MKIKFQENGSVAIALDDVDYKISGVTSNHRQWENIVEPYLDGGGVIEAYVPIARTAEQRRTATVADSGYGTVGEQLEIFYDAVEASSALDINQKLLDGLGVYFAHIQTIKTNIPIR